MNDKLHNFFNDTEFDVHEPHSGHQDRFLKKLKHPKKKSYSWKWLSLAASVLLLLGFYLGNFHQKNKYDLKDVSSEMAEAQNFFINTINHDLKKVEQYRNLNTESVIEDALEELEELEDQYNDIQNELKTSDNKRLKIKAMIQNYQQRLDILQRLLDRLNELENPTKFNIKEDEII